MKKTTSTYTGASIAEKFVHIAKVGNMITIADDVDCLPPNAQMVQTNFGLYNQPCFYDLQRMYLGSGFEVNLNLSQDFDEWLEAAM